MDEQVLKIVVPEPETFRVQCPTCERTIEGIEMTQDDYGAWHADGPDEFPRCDECDTLFQIARVAVIHAP